MGTIDLDINTKLPLEKLGLLLTYLNPNNIQGHTDFPLDCMAALSQN